MATNNVNAFKTYGRNKRQATIETDFNMGMMFTNGAVDFNYVKMLVNYDMYNNGTALIPRAGLRTSEIVLPNIVAEASVEDNAYHNDTELCIKAAKECVEFDGNVYRQFILGRVSGDETDARLWVTTSAKSDVKLDVENNIGAAVANADTYGMPCTYFTAPLTKIHGMEMQPESKVATLIGTFAFGNSYYFINPNTGLYKTYFDEDLDRYTFEDITPKTLDPSEAVTYGYNMLQGNDAYNFINRSLAGVIQLTGILPYSTSEESKLLMTPKKNEDIYFRCFFKGEVGQKYKFVWEWRNVGDSSWNEIVSLKKAVEYEIVSDSTTEALDKVILKDVATGTLIDYEQIAFKAPTEEIMIRVQVYNTKDLETVEKAMTVGFDFTVDSDNSNVKQEVYDLKTATGMTYWKNRLIMWGVTKDPTILFISDLNEPAYFPYPNNITVYDEPIVSVKPFLDSLLVFTSSKVFQVVMNEDGSGWTSTIIQSHLSIEPWDRHLIQVVKNMVFFKSGNYYFMLVPKAQSTTGELSLAPVSNPVVEFFNHFQKNIEELLLDVFDYSGFFELVDYYNFLDYEDVHNMYVLYYGTENDEQSGYLHLDIIYNTVSRSWRIYTLEAPHFLYPYKQDATQTGTLASTSLLNMISSTGSTGALFDVKEPEAIVEDTDMLYLASTGYDFFNTNELIVKVYDVYGAEYFETKFTTYRLEDNNFVLENTDCILKSEVVDSDTDFRLIAKSGNRIFKLGSSVAIYDVNDLVTPIWGPESVEPNLYTQFIYNFEQDFIQKDSVIEVLGDKFKIDTQVGNVLTSSETTLFSIEILDEGYLFLFGQAFDNEIFPIIRVYNTSDSIPEALGRCIQLYNFDKLNVQDLYVPDGVSLIYSSDTSNGFFGYNPLSLIDSFQEVMKTIEDRYLFKNWQFIDTGYRDDNLHLYKRYRELQFQLNNTEGVNLEFGLEFRLDGQSRVSNYLYETEHVIDESDPDYGLLYIQSTPYMNLPLEYISTPNETELGPGASTWVLNQSLFPELSLWKVRMPISGKGAAPRMRLLSRNIFRYELMSINWIYRIMNMR